MEPAEIKYQALLDIERIIFSIDQENLENSVQSTFQILSSTCFPKSIHFMIARYLYSAFLSRHLEVTLMIDYLLQVDGKNKITPSILDLFIDNNSELNSEESHFILEKMVERNLVKSNTVIYIKTNYFAHYQKDNKYLYNDRFWNTFSQNYEELKKNDWKLHKKLIKEGVNPNEISKIIRNDEIEKLQEISSQTNFNYNQTIAPSLYERYSFINQNDVTLIDYAAFFSSIKCFKYLLMNGAKVENTGKYAVAGGNEEIIHLCEQNHSSFKDAYEAAIEYHQNHVFRYLYNKNYGIKDLVKLGMMCIKYDNYIVFSFLEEKGLEIDEHLVEMSIQKGNAFILKIFEETHQIPNYFLPNFITNGNKEIVKLLIKQERIDVNAKDIYLFYLKFIFRF